MPDPPLDYRFSLANERTFLAWIRTALGLIAGAVAVLQLVPPFALTGAREVIGLALGAAGLLAAVLAFPRWRVTERAMQRGGSLPGPVVLLGTAVGISVVGAVVLVLALVDTVR